MEKITKFRDIPQFTSDGCYQVNYPIMSLVRYIEEEVDTMANSLTQLLEPIIIVVMAVIVGVIVVAIYSPIMSMYDAVDNY